MSEPILLSKNIERDSDQTNNLSFAKAIYTVLMAVALLSHLWLMVNGTGIDNIPTYIWIIRILPVPFAISLGKLWKDRGFQILFLYFLLFFFRCFIPNPGSIFSVDMAESILSALWLFAACYGLARTLNVVCLKWLLFICSIIWIFSIALFSCLGIYSVWTEKQIFLFSDKAIQFFLFEYRKARLEIFYVSTTAGAILSITALIDIILIAQIKKQKVVKGFLVVALIPIIISIAFTDSRTAIISVSIGIALMVFLWRMHYYQIKKALPDYKRYKWRLWITTVLLMIIVFIFLVMVILQIGPLVNQIKMKGIVPNAIAEENERANIASRGFDRARLLSGRKELWESIIEYIKHNKYIIIFGESKQNPLIGFDQYYGHCHNIYLQVFLESGIPGLLLFILFIIHVMKSVFTGMHKRDLPAWIYLLPAVPISLWVSDLVECFTWIRSSFCLMSTALFISTGMINTLMSRNEEELRKHMPKDF